MQGQYQIDLAMNYNDMRTRQYIDDATRTLDAAARDGTSGVRERIGLSLIRVGLSLTPQRT